MECAAFAGSEPPAGAVATTSSSLRPRATPSRLPLCVRLAGASQAAERARQAARIATSPSTSADLEHVVLGVPLGLACAVGHSRSATWQLACHCVRKIQASEHAPSMRRSSFTMGVCTCVAFGAASRSRFGMFDGAEKDARCRERRARWARAQRCTYAHMYVFNVT